MAIFGESYYKIGENQFYDTVRYQQALLDEIKKLETTNEKADLLKIEAIEITRHVTDGIRDLIKHDRRIRYLVLEEGLIPLATWADSLDNMASLSMKRLKYKILDMKKELEQGKIEGFPGTMFLFSKPTFTTLEGFYNVIFELAEDMGLI